MALNFQQRSSTLVRRAVFGALLVVSVALVTVYAKEGPTGPLHEAQVAVSGLVAPLETMGGVAANTAGDTVTALEDAVADEETLSGLRQYNAQLIEQYAQGEEYRQEAERLRALLDLKDAYSIEGVGARVIGRSAQAWSQTITIDKGSAQGVDSGQTVMGSTGVIGQIVATTENTATVRLLSDPQSGAAAIVQSSRAEGIVRGSLEGLLFLEDLAADAQVQVGDVVLTSGLGGSYTKGLLIGTVVKVSSSGGGVTRKIVVSSNDEAALLEEVLVVFSAKSSALNGSGDASASSDTQSGENGTNTNTRAATDGASSTDEVAAADASAQTWTPETTDSASGAYDTYDTSGVYDAYDTSGVYDDANAYGASDVYDVSGDGYSDGYWNGGEAQ